MNEATFANRTCLFHPGEPVAKARARITRFGNYTPDKTKAAQRRLKDLFMIAWCTEGFDKIEGPIELSCKFWLQIPKSASKKKRAAMIGQPCLKKPDVDNLKKLVLDAGNEAEIWGDDCQVYKIQAEKFWSETPGTSIKISWQ